jgi:predicted AAA+ superfamily ATPase
VPLVWSAETRSEIRRDKLFETILAGGYPPVATRQTGARRKAWFQSYLMTILQRDVRDLTAVPRLLAVVPSRTDNLLNFADLSRNLGLPQTTLKRYSCWK